MPADAKKPGNTEWRGLSSVHSGFWHPCAYWHSCVLFQLKETSTVATTDTDEPTRRDFLYVATGAFAAIGVGGVAWPLIDQMNPDASALALASIEVDLSPVEVGQAITVKWRGKPVFIRHRTAKEIEEAESVDVLDLRDPQTDADRVIKPEWLVMVGICTHLGCVPKGQQVSDEKGDYDGWFCPCHGSHYDTSGRIRRGPAPLNLEVPEYAFQSDDKIKIG
ncbi:MAG: ubiquinol-cytochrome c reductase iron-sulfur subunit [Alphaproteobacteria bacterium]|nr:ubiquinol-cytochrome c reductase iron-sulfur subunit [Alphaproteobacteria bacterium]MBO6627232.1 ubiquinol-cytochrome c reductase iron-sulfur subunit [Alphaproteobacteria bacterium]